MSSNDRSERSSTSLGTALDLSEGADIGGVIFVLRVSDGPDVGAAVVLDGVSEGRVLIGQSSVCEMKLSDRKVSRRHVALRREARAWRLQDLGSKNGTRVNGVRIHEAFLTGGETIAIGDTTLRLMRAGANAVFEPAADASISSAARDASLDAPVAFGRFLSVSEIIKRQLPRWASLANANLPLLVEGETGTGKELIAEAIHDSSSRAGRPFVILDCAGIAGGAITTALFGSRDERGARPGILEQAQGGTLLIDEPSDLDPSAQAVLASVLERGELTFLDPMGSSPPHPDARRPQRLDVRVITTSRRDLDREVQSGRFREDLLYRLAGATIELPALRHRPGDVSLLARTFWSQLGGAGASPPEDLLLHYENYEWPGNVRELLHAVASRLAVGDARGALAATPLRSPDARDTGRPPPPPMPEDVISRVLAAGLPFQSARYEVLHELEERFVEKVLSEHNGNISKAAAASGLARRYFQILNARRSSRAP